MEASTDNLLTVQEFVDREQIEQNNVRMTHKWSKTARHWKVTLYFVGRGAEMNDRRLSVFYSQGSAHTKPPTAADILDCLASDASGVENARSFEDWCGEFGYDTDSRSAEKTYRLCVDQAQELKAFLGADLYNELLWKTERM